MYNIFGKRECAMISKFNIVGPLYVGYKDIYFYAVICSFPLIVEQRVKFAKQIL